MLMFHYRTSNNRVVSEWSGLSRNDTMKVPSGVYGITSDAFGMSHLESARIFLEGGSKIIQLRDKDGETEKQIEEAIEIKKLCHKYGAVFIVNDRLDVAMKSDADGVHLGQGDTPLKKAKQMAGDWLEDKIIGISVLNVRQAVEAQLLGADYLGAGPVFPTNTKQTDEIIGLRKLKEIRDSVSIPVFAIGGIKLDHIKQMQQYGVDGIAVISAALAAKDPVLATKELVREWKR